MDINVALLPDDTLARELVRLSLRLAEETGSTLVLDNERGPFPHVTLYLTGYPEDTVGVIAGLLERNITHMPAPDLLVRGAELSPQGSVLLNVEKTRPLANLHSWMIHKLNPLRMGAKPAIWEERRHRYGPTELQRLAAVGFPQALEGWSPHATIGRVALERADLARAALNDVDLHGMARCIGVGTVGEHGTFTSLIAEARFGA